MNYVRRALYPIRPNGSGEPFPVRPRLCGKLIAKEVDIIMRRKDFLAAAASVAATLATSKAALAQTYPSTPPPARGEVGSARNIVYVRRRLETLIDQLQKDQHDFGGYRVRAIAALQQARADLDQALQWDATHPH